VAYVPPGAVGSRDVSGCAVGGGEGVLSPMLLNALPLLVDYAVGEVAATPREGLAIMEARGGRVR